MAQQEDAMRTRFNQRRSLIAGVLWSSVLLAGLPSLAGTQSKVTDLLLKEETTAPDFTLKGVDGKQITLSALISKKKTVLLHFFFLGSDFCRMALPHLQKNYEQFSEAGLEIVCVNVGPGDSSADIKGHWKASKFTMPVAKNGSGANDVFKTYRGINSPTNYLIGKERKIISRWVGFLPKNGADRLKQELGKADFR
jgi:peroxiredoxin